MDSDSTVDDSEENIEEDDQSSGMDEDDNIEASSEDEDDETKSKRPRKSDDDNCDDYFYLKHASKGTQCGPVAEIEGIIDPIAIFSLFITDAIINEIVNCTNQKIKIKKVGYKRENNLIAETNPDEIKALIGIIILSGVTKTNRWPITFMFNTKFSGSIFKATMPCERCRFLLSCLKFKNVSKQSIFADTFTPIKDIWNSFVANCKAYYDPGDFVTAGEYLVSFRGRCPFKTYSPNHKRRYGIRMVVLADTFSNYIINSLPHIPTDSVNKKSANLSVVKKLTEHLYGSNKNVTIINNLASVPLAKLFLQDPYKLTIVGALKSKIGEIKSDNADSLHSETSIFDYNEHMKLLSFKPKQHKRQFIVSTLHNLTTTDDFANIDLFEFYNKTKSVIDDFRKTIANYTVNRRTDNWETCIFYFMIDIALINVYVIYRSNINKKGLKSLSRRELLSTLSEQLMMPWLERRYTNVYLPKDTKNLIREVLGKDPYSVPSTPLSDSTAESRATRKKCAFCHWKIHRMTRYFCKGCNKPICGEHNVPVCGVCAEVI